MSCNCKDCRPRRPCASPGCAGTPLPAGPFCRDCEDERADLVHDEAKDRRLEDARP